MSERASTPPMKPDADDSSLSPQATRSDEYLRGLLDAERTVGLAAWKHAGDDSYSQGMDTGARHQVKECVHAVRRLIDAHRKQDAVDAAEEQVRASARASSNPSPPDAVLEAAVTVALRDKIKEMNELDQVPGKQAAVDALTKMSRAVIDAYQKATSSAPPDALEALEKMYRAFNAKKPIPKNEADALEIMCRKVLSRYRGRK